MTVRPPPDPPTPADALRLRRARRAARAAMTAVEARCAALRLAAFRAELMATVRSVSPFLIALMEAEGVSDAALWRLFAAPPGWPARSRRGAAASRGVDRVDWEGSETSDRCGFRLGDGGWAAVSIRGHSIEVSTRVRPILFRSRHGRLGITLLKGFPFVLAVDAIGRPIEDLLLHPATSGRGWTVDDVAIGATGVVIAVDTGSSPWPRR